MSILWYTPEKGAYQPEERLLQKNSTWKGPILFLTASQTSFAQGELISGSAAIWPDIYIFFLAHNHQRKTTNIVVFISGIGWNSHPKLIWLIPSLFGGLPMGRLTQRAESVLVKVLCSQESPVWRESFSTSCFFFFFSMCGNGFWRLSFTHWL